MTFKTERSFSAGKIFGKILFLKTGEDIINKASKLFYYLMLLVFISVLTEYIYDMKVPLRTFVYFTIVPLILVSVLYIIYFTARKIYRALKYPREIIRKNDIINKDVSLLVIHDLEKISPDNIFAEQAVNDIISSHSALIDKKQILDKGIIKKILFRLSIMIVIAFAVLNTQLNSAFVRIIEYDKDFTPPPSHYLTADRQSIYAADGDSVTVGCSVKGKEPEFIYFNKRYFDEEFFYKKKIPVHAGKNISEKISDDKSFYFFFSSEETVSDTGKVTYFPRPGVSEIKISVNAPEYTGIERKEYDNVFGTISAYKGSFVKFEIRSDIEDIDSVKIYQNGRPAVQNTEGNYFSYGINFTNETVLNVKMFYSTHGLIISNNEEIRYDINLIEDEYPSVELYLPEKDLTLDESLDFPVAATASDDFNITKCSLFLRKISFNEFTGKEMSSDYVSKALNIKNKDRSGSVVINEYANCSELNPLPEDKVEMFIRVYDNDIISGPKYTDSEHRFMLLPSIEQLFSSTEDNYQGQEKALKEELEASRSVLERINEMTEKLKRNEELGKADSKKYRELLEDQDKMGERINNLQNEIEKNMSLLDKNSLLSEETMKKYMKLQKFMDDLFTQEMKEKLKKLNDLSNTGDYNKEQYMKLLNDFEQHQETFKEGIEKSMEILEQIKNEYMLDRLIAQIEKLITSQNELNRSIESKNIPAEKYLSTGEKIDKDHGFFMEQLKDLDENIEDKRAEKIYEDAQKKNIDDDIDKIKEYIKKQDMNNAGNKGNSVSLKMTDVKNDLMSLKEDIAKEQKENLKKEIREIISDLILISDDIEQLKNFSKDLGSETSHSARIIKSFTRSSKIFESVRDEIFDISKRTFFIDRTAIAMVGRIEQLFRSISGFFSNRYFSFSYDRNVLLMDGINDLASKLIKINNELESSKSPSGIEEMLKKMEEMAKRQQSINSQTSSMSMQGMSQMQQLMNRLAMEQSQLYEQLMKMQSQMGSKEGQQGEKGSPSDKGSPGQGKPSDSGMKMPGMDGQPGSSGQPINSPGGNAQGQTNSGLGKRLGDIGDSMKKIEKQLKDKKLDENLMSEQKKVLDKLLETIESVKREKYERKRESRSGKRSAVDPGRINIEDNINLQEKLNRSLKDGYTNKYKIKIKNYFKELNY